ncbi:MAG TPA: hypothetical protein VK550_25970 [Polyangiaceae bacterium]|jgi:hypothetical protein|nr:hypothetical protein [Polyangiaceae bacterium]
MARGQPSSADAVGLPPFFAHPTTPDYGPRLKVLLALAGRDALYLSQQLGHRHCAVTAPFDPTCRTTRHPKRMLSRVDESESSSLGGGVAPHPQQAGCIRISVMGTMCVAWHT